MDKINAAYTPETKKRNWISHRHRSATRKEHGEDTENDFTPEKLAIAMDTADDTRLTIKSKKKLYRQFEAELEALWNENRTKED